MKPGFFQIPNELHINSATYVCVVLFSDMVSQISEAARHMMSDAEVLRPEADEMSDAEVQSLMSDESSGKTAVRETSLITNSPFVESVTDLDVDAKDTEATQEPDDTEREGERDESESERETPREVDRFEETIPVEDVVRELCDIVEREMQLKASDSDDDNYHDVTDGSETTDVGKVNNNNDVDDVDKTKPSAEEAQDYNCQLETSDVVGTESPSQILTPQNNDDDNDVSNMQGSMTTDLDEGGASDFDLDPDVSVIPNSLESASTDLDDVTKPKPSMDTDNDSEVKSEKCDDSEITADADDETGKNLAGPIEI